jgi:6-phospho-3-hexuloisomerase
MSPAAILAELDAVFDGFDAAPLDRLAERIGEAGRVVCAGQGRSGMVAAALAVRLVHLGVVAHVAGEATQPAVGRGDLLVAFSRTGETAMSIHQAERARAAGAGIAVVTGRAEGALARLADALVLVPSAAVRSGQHAGSLFEQAALIAADCMAARLQRARGLGHDVLSARHDNLQ